MLEKNIKNVVGWIFCEVLYGCFMYVNAVASDLPVELQWTDSLG